MVWGEDVLRFSTAATVIAFIVGEHRDALSRPNHMMRET